MSDGEDWYGPESATFGDRLAASRDAAGLNQSTFARRLGVKLKTVQNWEQDLSEPRANRLSMMASMLNVSIVWLITGEGEGVTPPDEDPIPADLNAVLTDIRSLRADLRVKVDELGLLEKRLRNLL